MTEQRTRECDSKREGRERKEGRLGDFLRRILVKGKGERGRGRGGREQGADFSEPHLNERCEASKQRTKK